MAELRYFEDIEPGETAEAGPFEITREAIIAFAAMYDPQAFHLDEAVAKASILEGLAASGWQTSAIGMRLFHEAFVRHVASMGSPGIDEGRWLRPVRPNDRLSLLVTVQDKRTSESRADRGFLGIAIDLRNGAGESMMTQRFTMIVQRRGTIQAGHGTPPVLEAAYGMPGTPDPDLGLTAFYDDIEVGGEARLGAQLFTADDIIAFAKIYDPQYFHLDAEHAKESHFGGLIASGWQTAAYWMKHYITARDRSSMARAAAGLPAAVGGPSPGFTNLKWRRPVYAGETIAYALKVTAKRPMPRPGWGIIFTENTGRAADGTVAFSFEGRLIWPMAET